VVTGEWRRLHNDELSALHSSPNNIRVIKSGRMRRTVLITQERWGDLRESNYVKDPGVDGKIIPKSNFKNWDRRAWTGSIWLRIGTGGGLL
jgi:hypothetical protein